MASSKVVYSPEYLAQDRTGRVIATGVVMCTLEVFFFILYMTSRIKSKTAISWETWIMIPAFLFNFALGVQLFLYVHYGGEGRHVASLPLHTVENWLKLQLAESFLYSAAVMLPKLAVLCLYHRLFKLEGLRPVIYAIGALLVLTWMASWIISGLYCTPISYFWTRVHKGSTGTCVDTHEVFIWITLPNLITDVIILIIPQLVVWKLRMSRMKKIGLALTFLTGSIGVVTAAVRLYIFATTYTGSDNPWLSIPTTALTTVEPGVYFIAACLPSLGSLFGSLFRKSWDMLVSSRFMTLAFGSGSKKNPSAEGDPKVNVHLSGCGSSGKSSNTTLSPHAFRNSPNNVREFQYSDIAETNSTRIDSHEERHPNFSAGNQQDRDSRHQGGVSKTHYLDSAHREIEEV